MQALYEIEAYQRDPNGCVKAFIKILVPKVSVTNANVEMNALKVSALIEEQHNFHESLPADLFQMSNIDSLEIYGVEYSDTHKVIKNFVDNINDPNFCKYIRIRN